MIFAKHNAFHKAIMGCALVSILASCTLSNATANDIADSIAQTSVESIQQTQVKIKDLFPATLSPYYLKTLSTLYSVNGMKPMWADAQATKEFEQQLVEVALAGFQPQFSHWVTQLADPNLKGMARDVTLSDAMLGYLHYLDGINENGQRWLYQRAPYALAVPTNESIAQWQTASQKSEVLNRYIASLAPQQANYSAMREAMLSFLRDDTVWPKLSVKKTIRVGNTLAARDIEALQTILGHTVAWSGNGSVAMPADERRSNKYTKSLANAVKEFQALHGLSADGSLGRQTVAWLNVTPQERAALMALNIQRLRLLPVKYDSNIMVNIPDFSLVYYVDGAEILTSRVIVGRFERKTPMMKNALTNVVINPPWNVPTKLIREDIVPKLKRDPEYLKRQGYTVYSGWGKGSEVVDTSAIDWSEVSPKNVNFRFQQSPGVGNALGRYKFNMPNSEAIYLHDTPNHRSFDKSNRALSSGCVRVNQSAKLASLLLNGSSDWNDDRIKRTVKGGKTTHVNLSGKVPVQLYYMTAWISNGKYPQFRNDIYRYDGAAKLSMKSMASIKTLLSY